MTQQQEVDFPKSAQLVGWLIEQHKQIKDEPLLFALYFAPERDPQNIFVFEVIDNFGSNTVDQDNELFEYAYNGSATIPIRVGHKLIVVATNPVEMEVAFRGSWPQAMEIRAAVKRGAFRILHQDEKAHRFMEVIVG